MQQNYIDKNKFIAIAKAFESPSILVTVVQLPTGAKEVITNNQCIKEKIDYLDTAYDEQFRLKANNNDRIVGVLIV